MCILAITQFNGRDKANCWLIILSDALSRLFLARLLWISHKIMEAELVRKDFRADFLDR